jgi:hypothetical protein
LLGKVLQIVIYITRKEKIQEETDTAKERRFCDSISDCYQVSERNRHSYLLEGKQQKETETENRLRDSIENCYLLISHKENIRKKQTRKQIGGYVISSKELDGKNRSI